MISENAGEFIALVWNPDWQGFAASSKLTLNQYFLPLPLQAHSLPFACDFLTIYGALLIHEQLSVCLHSFPSIIGISWGFVPNHNLIGCLKCIILFRRLLQQRLPGNALAVLKVFGGKAWGLLPNCSHHINRDIWKKAQGASKSLLCHDISSGKQWWPKAEG